MEQLKYYVNYNEIHYLLTFCLKSKYKFDWFNFTKLDRFQEESNNLLFGVSHHLHIAHTEIKKSFTNFNTKKKDKYS